MKNNKSYSYEEEMGFVGTYRNGMEESFLVDCKSMWNLDIKISEKREKEKGGIGFDLGLV